jgi:hypothetical protein
MAGQDMIRIRNPAAGLYMIGVYAYGTCSFTLSATSASGSTVLQDGVAVFGALDQEEYRYYRILFDSDAPNIDLTISLTAFSGDPDVYISTKYPQPNPTNSTWSGSAWGDDSVTIARTDDNFCSHCWYYIAVKAFQTSSYTILASFDRQIQLTSGRPVVGHVARHAMVYYSFFATGSNFTDITISATPSVGTPQLCVKRDTEPASINDCDWISSVWGGAMIDIQETEPWFRRDAWYIIAVYGYTVSDYSLVASTSTSHTILRPGIPVRDSVALEGYQYYKFQTVKGGDDVNIVATTITGDADLYVSRFSTKPSTIDFEWTSRQWGDDAVYIEGSAIETYYIAVYGYRAATYTLTANIVAINNTHSSLLVDGIPQNGWLDAETYDYFRFNAPSGVDHLTLSVTRRSGDPDLYIRNDGQTPTNTFYQWSSASWGQDVVTIDYPSPGEYIVAVFAFSATSYVVVASTADNTQTLLDGVPFSSTLRAPRYMFFQFNVPYVFDRSLTITVTSFNGDPDLFVSKINQHPTLDNYTWAARSIYEDSITIVPPELTPGYYFIGIQAYTNITFTVVASLQSPTLLIDGQPHRATVAKEAERFFEFIVAGELPNFVSIVASPFQGSLGLFVGTGDKWPSINDPTSYQYESWAMEGPQQIIIHNNEVNFCPNKTRYGECFFKVMVYGLTSSNFLLTAHGSRSGVQLMPGQPQTSWIMKGTYGYFFFQNDIKRASLGITVTANSGDPVCIQTPIPIFPFHIVGFVLIDLLLLCMSTCE